VYLLTLVELCGVECGSVELCWNGVGCSESTQMARAVLVTYDVCESVSCTEYNSVIITEYLYDDGHLCRDVCLGVAT
jgi:hypothetical protein